MAPSNPLARTGDCKFAAIEIPRELSKGRSVSPLRSNKNNFPLRKPSVGIVLTNEHASVPYGMITVFLVGNPFKIFYSIVCFYRILVINGYFSASVFPRRRIKKRKRNEYVNKAVIFFAIKSHDNIKITTLKDIRFSDGSWPPFSCPILPFDSRQSAFRAYLIRQYGTVSKDNSFPFHESLVPQVVLRSQGRLH